MSTLYELTGVFVDIEQMELDDETFKDTLESIDWSEQFVEKVEGYAKVIKNLEADVPGIDEEIKRLQAKKKALTNKISHLKDTVKTAMEVTGNERVATPLFRVSVANSKASVVVDEEILSAKYKIKTVTVKPDKKQLYDLLKEGKRIKGASLQPNRSLRIS